MAVNNLSELFEHELKDIYYAEHRLLEALEQLAGETRDRDAKKAYTTHRRETQGQIKRLQKVFKMLGEVPETEKCPGIEGLLKEKQNFTKKEKPSQEILDFFNLCAAVKTERYEISAYESLIQIGEQIGMEQAVELLAQNLAEEEATLEKLQMLAQAVDKTPMMPQEEEDGAGASRGGSKGAAKGGTKGAAKGSKSTSGSKSSSKAAKASRSGASTKNSPSKGAAKRGGGGRSRTGQPEGAETGMTMDAPDDAMNVQTYNDTV